MPGKMAHINKSAFFQHLDSLDHASDNDEETNDCDKLAEITQKTENSLEVPAVPILRESLLKKHSSSASRSGENNVTEMQSPDCANTSRETHPKRQAKRPVERLQSGNSKTSKKQRPDLSRSIPESGQIFKDLVFFFIPNNNICPARRFRIQRSQDYGASWAQTWSADITHVIVDRGLDYKEVLKVLTSEQLSGDVALVNQDYISDCLAFGTVLRVTQLRFQVDGNPAVLASKGAPAESSTLPNDSLPMKPVKQDRRRHQRSLTPSQSEETPAGPASSTTAQQRIAGALAHKPGQRDGEVLEELIQKVKAAGDLPLDENDYEEALGSVFEIDPNANDPSNNVPAWQKNFTCMQKHDGTSLSKNPNIRTIETLQKMADYYEQTADNWRSMAYRKAISGLKKMDSKVSTKTQALAVSGIGQRLADKIEEIVSTDRLRRLENTSLTPEDKSLQLFLGVYGAGFMQASKWVAMGFRSLEDLRTKTKLTANQKIGVERFSDFQRRIPRAEVTLHGDIVRAAVQELDPEMKVTVAGSYRRGAADCGDIDVLITKPTATIEYIRNLMIEYVVPRLTQKGFLKVSLATTSRGDGSKWHGASALSKTDVWRRIDLLFVPGNEIGAALLYFTGNDIFNRSLRLLARKKGMRLNQRGLYKDVLRGAGQVKVTEGCLVEGQDERRILEILGVPWRPPEHRIC